MRYHKEDPSEEIWLEIPCFSRYSISDFGRVRNNTTDRVLIQNINQQGNVSVCLSQSGKQHRRCVAGLVAEAFVPNPKGYPFDTPVHCDGDKTNNQAENLIYRPRWFALEFQKQFSYLSQSRILKPIQIRQTGEVFPNSREASIALTVLERDIVNDVCRQGSDGVFPYWYNFEPFRKTDIT
jgi:hypothetical protein